MRTLYIDCGMGAAGDMLTAALLELVPDPKAFVKRLNTIGISNVEYILETSTKCGIVGSHMKVLVAGVEEEPGQDSCGHEHDHHHEHEHHHEPEEHHEHHAHSHFHASLKQVQEIINALDILDEVKRDAFSVYERIAQAESAVHGVAVSDIHFHEVGKMDAIADVVAVCMLMKELDVEQVIASPIHVGSGSVKCAHGILPVPAPATAYILQGCPIYGGQIAGELCTPTGAALLTHFVTKFGDMPVMAVEKIGYGMGKKDFAKANCIRVMLGQTSEANQTITELSCNLDDMTAEELGFAMERFFDGRALEVFTVPCNMKKDRPGTILYVICENEDVDTLVPLIFKHTTTLGIRKNQMERFRLKRSFEQVITEYGSIQKKCATGFGVCRYKYEYEDLAKIAREQKLSIAQVRKIADMQEGI